MTPDIKGLVERLRNNATDCFDDSRWATPELAPLLNEAADALERFSAPPAVPATPVAWEWPKVLAIKRPHNRWHGELSFAEQPTDEELDNLKAFLNEHHKNAAPVPAHSDVREALDLMHSARLSSIHNATAKERLLNAIQELNRVWFSGPDIDKDAVSQACLGLFREAHEVRNLSTTAQSGDQK